MHGHGCSVHWLLIRNLCCPVHRNTESRKWKYIYIYYFKHHLLSWGVVWILPTSGVAMKTKWMSISLLWPSKNTIIDLFHSGAHDGFVHLNVPLSNSSEPDCSRILAIQHLNGWRPLIITPAHFLWWLVSHGLSMWFPFSLGDFHSQLMLLLVLFNICPTL